VVSIEHYTRFEDKRASGKAALIHLAVEQNDRRSIARTVF
jgi:hypothetical protein